MRTLTPTYLHEFKQETRTKLENIDLKQSVYNWINNDYSITKMPLDPLIQYAQQNKTDMDTIIENYKTSNKFLALIGSGGFAKCYITSEYLRTLFQKGDHGIEYTAVVCGYLKNNYIL